ncbi:MAG: glucose-6-phosphate dehydrogenase [Candidatus Thorarchaeota archaeon]
MTIKEKQRKKIQGKDTSNLKKPEPCLLILFGASGDLSKRKIIPAVYNLIVEGILPKNFCILGISRRISNNLTFHEIFFDSIVKYTPETWKIDVWSEIKERIFGFPSDIYKTETFEKLKQFITHLDNQFHINGHYFYYLATAPNNYFQIIHSLHNNNMLNDTSKIVIEKPFGLDLISAKKLHQDLLNYFKSNQIFKIDHYLGKEPIQNIIVFRKNNPLFQLIWSNRYINRIEIIVAETVGVDKRADYFEQTGILKDMVQSHLLQILALLTMKLPEIINPETLKRNKINLLKSIRRYTEEKALENSIRGQYGEGKLYTKRSGYHEVKAYRNEDGINLNSNIETFVAIKAFIDNENWENVPFYLVAGKRLKKRLTEIRIYIKSFNENEEITGNATNMIKLRIQPRPQISLRISFLQPGILSTISPTHLKVKGERKEPKAYERLLLDAMLGDQSAFVSQEEIEEQWDIVEPFAKAWEKNPPKLIPNYDAGSFGPEEVNKFMPNFSF